MGNMQLFNNISLIALIAGIMFALAAVVIFVQAGIREYFVVTHHRFREYHTGNTGLLEKNVYEEETSEEHSVKDPSEVLNAAETEKKPVPGETPIENPAEEDSDGCGKTDDLGGSSTFPDGYEQNEGDQDDDALTGVLVQETEALTGVLDQGFDETSRLKLSPLTVKKDIEMNQELWAAPVPEVIMTETHHIVFVHTDKNIS